MVRRLDRCPRIAAMAKPYNVPVIPGSGVYNYHFVQSNLNSPFAEFLSVQMGISSTHFADRSRKVLQSRAV